MPSFNSFDATTPHDHHNHRSRQPPTGPPDTDMATSTPWRASKLRPLTSPRGGCFASEDGAEEKNGHNGHLGARQSCHSYHMQTPTPLSRRSSEESIRTEFCEGPVSDGALPGGEEVPVAGEGLEALATPENDVVMATSDRAELIERLKRGESPTWVPSRHLESLFQKHSRPSTPQSPRPPSSGAQSLLPAAAISPRDRPIASDDVVRTVCDGLEIERPRSALHSGNFTPEASNSPHGQLDLDRDGRASDRGEVAPSNVSGLGVVPWRGGIPGASGLPSLLTQRAEPGPSPTVEDWPSAEPSSSVASSFASSFVYRFAPTSPLVQSELSEDINSIPTPGPQSRRYTMDWALPKPTLLPPSVGFWGDHTPFYVRRDVSVPCRAHQPRRSSNAGLMVNGSPNPQTPLSTRLRRPSYGSEPSPIQPASLVGSYEESILRGRMSSSPSRPLDFLAQIGVLGLGQCKSALRCPRHVTLPFHAFFYRYSIAGHGRTATDDSPSPYVGAIDLENGLPNPEEEARATRKMQARNAIIKSSDGGASEAGVDGGDWGLGERPRNARNNRRSSASARAPPGGSYRIPEKGQIQIVIKNQNKTAVKLFLVPYDLAGMKPGTKTFIRQRCYSAGPIIDNIVPSTSPIAIPSSQNTTVPQTAERPTLRYLVHLHMCCPSRGRYYLYKDIRVVFANRVPDGKERLRTDITFPEPRFSPYKPIRPNHPPHQALASGLAASLAARKAYLRRNSSFSLGRSGQALDILDGVGPRPPADHAPANPFGVSNPAFPTSAPLTSRQGDASRVEAYEKRSPSDFPMGSPAQGTEGILSQKLRSLGVQSQAPPP